MSRYRRRAKLHFVTCIEFFAAGNSANNNQTRQLFSKDNANTYVLVDTLQSSSNSSSNKTCYTKVKMVSMVWLGKLISREGYIYRVCFVHAEEFIEHQGITRRKRNPDRSFRNVRKMARK